MRCNLSLRDASHNLGHRHRHALEELGLRLEKRVQHADALRDHGDFQLVDFLEVLQELFERHLAINLEAIPQSPLRLVVLLGLGALWLGESAQRQSEIDETVLVAIEGVEAETKT